MADTNSKGSNTTKYATAAIVVVIIAGVLFFSLRSSILITTSTTTITSVGPGLGNLSIQLTDPPTVPAGTQSLIVAYSGVDLHETGMTNSTGFMDFPVSGTINLLNLTNVSQTIAVIRAQANQSFNMIRFDIKSANITINNVTYNVTVAVSGVVARINSSVNAASSGGVLIDLSPTVLQVYTNANQSIFVMVPSVGAVAIGKGTLSSKVVSSVGATAALSGNLATAIHAQRPNISITLAAASEAGNLTQLRISVKNNGNSTVRLSDVVVRGFMEAMPAFGSWTWPPGVANPGVEISAPINTEPTVGIGSTIPLNSSLNSTVVADLHAGPAGATTGGTLSASAALGVDEAEIFYRDFHNQLNFMVESNGTLELPYDVAMVACPAIIVSGGNATAVMPNCQIGSFGYSLAPGASVNLTFSGVITMPNVGVVVSTNVGVQPESSASAAIAGPRVGSAVIVLIPNQTYSVAVHGNRGASASAKVTATGYITSYRPGIVDVTSVDLGLHDTSSGTTYNETMSGFISHTNSTVAYSIYSYGGVYATALPRLPSYLLNVTGFQVNTAGFTLLNYSVVVQPSPPCPVCAPGQVCPDYCIAGTGKLYLLHIRVPPVNYTGTLSITEDYTSITNITAT